MIDRGHDLSITKQAEVLKISRGSIYYLPRPVSSADLAIMRHLDRLHLEFPFAGSRMLRGLLALQGCKIGRRHEDGDRGALSSSAHHQARTRPQDPSVSAARHRDHASKPSLGYGHHLHPDGARLRLSRRRARLGDTSCFVLAVVDHDGSSLLRRDTGRCFGPSRQAGHLQHR